MGQRGTTIVYNRSVSQRTTRFTAEVLNLVLWFHICLVEINMNFLDKFFINCDFDGTYNGTLRKYQCKEVQVQIICDVFSLKDWCLHLHHLDGVLKVVGCWRRTSKHGERGR